MGVFDHPDFDQHDSLHFIQDSDSGLKAIIAIHSTALGPAAGGCRRWQYASDEDALTDALRLSRGMSYKNAVADLPFGGGKAVILASDDVPKSPELFRAFGRAVASLDLLHAEHTLAVQPLGVGLRALGLLGVRRALRRGDRDGEWERERREGRHARKRRAPTDAAPWAEAMT